MATMPNKIPPQHIWLTIFLPALIYYILLSNKNSPHSPSSSNGILSQLGLFPNHFTTVSTDLHYHVLNNSNDSSSSSSSSSLSSLIDSIFKSKYSYSSSLKFEYIIQNKESDIVPLSPASASASSISSSVSKLVDTVWVEDIDLGRGYLLISDINNHGIIWRYEVGGGPIPIGKSLFMDYSGCRSNLWNKCSSNYDDAADMTTEKKTISSMNHNGSSGVTIQVSKDEETFLTGQLIIVEKGEQRIIRLEKDGSRTPLVLNVTTPLCQNNDDVDVDDSYRIMNPSLVHYTPFGDLLFTDRNLDGCRGNTSTSTSTIKEKGSGSSPVAGIYRLKEVVNVPSLSFQLSKDAHGWTESELQQYWKDNGSSSSTAGMELLYSGNFEYISGMVVGKDLTSLYIAGRTIDLDSSTDNDVSIRYVIIKVAIDDIEEDNDDDDNSNNKKLDNHDTSEKDKATCTSQRKEGLLDEKTVLFYDMTSFFQASNLCQSKLHEIDAGISLAIDENGLIYATYPNGVAIFDDSNGGILVATLALSKDDTEINDTSTRAGNGDVCNVEHTSNIIPNSINIGKDQYLYLTTEQSLMRMEIKTKPLEHPTNLIVPSKKSK